MSLETSWRQLVIEVVVVYHSLFYNINNKSVEDLTTQGLQHIIHLVNVLTWKCIVVSLLYSVLAFKQQYKHITGGCSPDVSLLLSEFFCWCNNKIDIPYVWISGISFTNCCTPCNLYTDFKILIQFRLLGTTGIKDLKAGIIRTPLPPKDTFLDDPLRVLRAVRFGEFWTQL